MTVNFLISYFRPTILSYYSSKLSNFWEKLTFQIRQNYPAPVGFLPEPDICRIWKSAGFRPEPKSGTALVCTVLL